MKKHSVERGLYHKDTTSTETDEELLAFLREQRGELDRYIADARRVAENILTDAGIDPQTLFQQEARCGGSRRRIDWIDRDNLPPTVDQALDVLESIELADLSDKGSRNGLRSGLQLAAAVDALNANLALFDDTTKGRRYSAIQAIKGKKGGDKRWASKVDVTGLYRKLALKRDGLGDLMDPSELWPELYSLLEADDFDIRETGGRQLKTQRYEIGGGESISYDAFRRAIARIRESS